MINIYLREQAIKHSKNIKMYSQKIIWASDFSNALSEVSSSIIREVV